MEFIAHGTNATNIITPLLNELKNEEEYLYMAL